SARLEPAPPPGAARGAAGPRHHVRPRARRPARRTRAAAAPRVDRERRPQLVRHVRGARPRPSRDRARPPRPRPRHPLTQVVPKHVASNVIHRVMSARSTAQPLSDWAVEELRRNDWTKVLEAGRALSRFDSRSWIGGVDVPTAVVAPQRDQLVPPRRQLALAR